MSSVTNVHVILVVMVTYLRLRRSLWLKYKGSSDIIVYRPQVCEKCARTMAHKGKEVILPSMVRPAEKRK